MVLAGFACLDRCAAEDHLQRLGHAGQPRQPLGAAGAGQQAELHFRQPYPGIRAGDAVMAAQRHFQPATQGRAVDDGNAGLAAALDDIDHLRQARRHGRLAEFLDVGPGKEGAALADQHHGAHLRVRFGGLKGLQQALAQRLAQRIDRRVVSNDQRDFVAPLQSYELRHSDLRCIEIYYSRNLVSHSRIRKSLTGVDPPRLIARHEPR